MKSEQGIIKIILLVVVLLCALFFLLFFIGKNSETFHIVGNSSSNSVVNQNYNPLLPQAPSSAANGSYLPPTGSTIGGYLGGALSLGSGSGPYDIQPTSEYITIRNNTSAPIDITGYRLENGKGSRPIENSQNSNITNVPSDKAFIPQGTRYLSPDSRYALQDIILDPGATAYIITGGPFISYSMPISASFEDNKCEGYLNSVYPFTPYLSNNCPRPENEIGSGQVSQQCYDYLKSIYLCTDPLETKQDKARHDAQTSVCQSFVDRVTTYKGCYDIHRYDDNFLTHDWRIFLGRPREMWASRNESIRLYNRAGTLVNQVSY